MIQYRGTGRRKTSVARVRLIPGGKGIEIMENQWLNTLEEDKFFLEQRATISFN